jgi:hypothetical protein
MTKQSPWSLKLIRIDARASGGNVCHCPLLSKWLEKWLDTTFSSEDQNPSFARSMTSSSGIVNDLGRFLLLAPQFGQTHPVSNCLIV